MTGASAPTDPARGGVGPRVRFDRDWRSDSALLACAKARQDDDLSWVTQELIDTRAAQSDERAASADKDATIADLRAKLEAVEARDRQHEADRARIAELEEALRLHEAWEAHIVMHADWDTADGLPHLTQKQMDALSEVQNARNRALRYPARLAQPNAGGADGG